MMNSSKRILIALALMIWGATAAVAMPRYTDKENALALANVLDKGQFGRYTISSTYVQNVSLQNYYVSVILSNGEGQNWHIDQIYKWTRDDKLTLSQNRTLLFLDSRETRFVVLDKNKFHRLALKANVYVKTYANNDPLRGRSFKHEIKSFNLISPNETAFGRDETGSKYRYIIDLMNGTSELLTFENAYRLIKANNLLVQKEVNDSFGRAYGVTKILPYPKGEVENGVAQFGVEVEFDGPIQLSEDHFPLEIYEQKNYNPRTKKYKRTFVMDMTIPNSVKNSVIRSISSLEYLHNIQIVKNMKYPKRTYLRAEFNDKVVDIPPVVYKNSDNSIYVNFFTLIDQSVTSRGMLLDETSRKDQAMKSRKTIRVRKSLKSDSDYGRAFVAALETHKQALLIKDPAARIEKFLDGIKQFEESALYSETDAQLYNALTRRNQLRENVIILTMDLIRTKLKQVNLGGANVKSLMDNLDRAETFTGNPEVLKSIAQLREKLIAAQQ